MKRFGVLKKLLPMLVAAMMLVMTLPANIALAATVGPIDARSVAPGSTAALSGFPAWYRDDNGVAVELFPVTAADNLIGDPNPANPYEVKLGFNTAFYWNAFGDIVFPNGGTGRIVFGYEAIWDGLGNGVVGQEVVFSRIRFGLKPGVPGTYTIQHPWGTDTMDVTAVDVANNRNVQFSDDVGILPRVFTAAITPPAARETTFLKSLSAPPGKLGDGVTPGPVTGGKLRNSVIVSGPAGTVTVTNFVIAGRLFAGIAPVASFTAAPATGASPLAVNFADTSIGPAASWLWNFGDGTAAAPSTSTLATPTHVYTTAGTFTVSLTVNNAVGPASTTTRLVTVTPAVAAVPVSHFIFTPTTGSAPLAVSFTDTSTGAPTAFSWNFGDGSPAVTAPNPIHTFLTAGTFTVTELVSNNISSAASSQIITVSAPVSAVPVASFTAIPSVGAPPLAVKFTDTTSGVPITWSWNFGDGSALSVLQSPTHTFATVGIFPVTVTVTNGLGTATATQVITVSTTAAGIPAAPTNLTGTATSSTSVSLTWTDNALNETLYMIQRATDAAFTAPSELHVPANSTTFTDVGVTAGSTFNYRVIAAGLTGNSATSNVITITTPAAGAPAAAPPPPPPPPSGGGGGGGGAPAPAPQPQAVSLTGFLTATGILSDDSGHVSADAQVKTANDEVVLNIPAGTAIIDRNNGRIASLTEAVQTAPPAAPAGETIVSAFNLGPAGAQFSPSIGITLKIDTSKVPANTPPGKLYMAFHNGTAWVKIDATLDDTAKTLSANIGHFTDFAIIAQAVAAPTPPPALVVPSDEIVAPSAPGSLTANVDESGAVSLHWAVTSPNENGFMIERAQDATFETGEAEFHVAAGTTSFTDITVATGKTYFYRVLAVTGVGHSPPSNVVSVSVKAPGPVAPATPPATPATTPPVTPSQPTAPVTPTPSTNWGLIIGIVAAALVVAVLVIALTRKKPATK